LYIQYKYCLDDKKKTKIAGSSTDLEVTELIGFFSSDIDVYAKSSLVHPQTGAAFNDIHWHHLNMTEFKLQAGIICHDLSGDILVIFKK